MPGYPVEDIRPLFARVLVLQASKVWSRHRITKCFIRKKYFDDTSLAGLELVTFGIPIRIFTTGQRPQKMYIIKIEHTIDIFFITLYCVGRTHQ